MRSPPPMPTPICSAATVVGVAVYVILVSSHVLLPLQKRFRGSGTAALLSNNGIAKVQSPVYRLL
jgi:hypothetical protein